jgi:hypothetical protein
VHRITSPSFLACQWTDEQTGGHCPDLASRFTGTRRKWFTFTNGTHVDSLDPATFNRWFDFIELYVARRAPNLSPGLRSLGPTIFQTAMGVPGVQLPDDPIQGRPTYEDALAAFESLPAVRILFDSGAGSSTPGRPFRASSTRSRAFRRPEREPARGTSRAVGPWPTPSPGAVAPTPSDGAVPSGPAPASPETRAPAPAGCGPPRPCTTGARTPPGPRCPT